jgi:hypothetical protein
MMVTVLTVVFCDGTLNSLAGRYQCFGGICCMFLQNVTIHIQHYTVSQSRRPQSGNVTLGKVEMCEPNDASLCTKSKISVKVALTKIMK